MLKRALTSERNTLSPRARAVSFLRLMVALTPLLGVCGSVACAQTGVSGSAFKLAALTTDSAPTSEQNWNPSTKARGLPTPRCEVFDLTSHFGTLTITVAQDDVDRLRLPLSTGELLLFRPPPGQAQLTITDAKGRVLGRVNAVLEDVLVVLYETPDKQLGVILQQRHPSERA